MKNRWLVCVLDESDLDAGIYEYVREEYQHDTEGEDLEIEWSAGRTSAVVYRTGKAKT